MRFIKRASWIVLPILLIAVCVSFTGCAVNFYKQNPRSRAKIKDLESKISDLEMQRRQERESFEEAKRMLEDKLRGQIRDKSISLSVDERGLVIVLSDDILFDSGKAVIKSKAEPILDKLAGVINSNFPNKNIGISGHTDNVPITHSSWASNWELSTARATTVLHYLESRGVSPSKLSATGYGEHRPIASNSTSDGRARNRRVEIVILPEFEEQRQDGIIK